MRMMNPVIDQSVAPDIALDAMAGWRQWCEEEAGRGKDTDEDAVKSRRERLLVVWSGPVTLIRMWTEVVMWMDLTSTRRERWSSLRGPAPISPASRAACLHTSLVSYGCMRSLSQFKVWEGCGFIPFKLGGRGSWGGLHAIPGATPCSRSTMASHWERVPFLE